ncbi:MAG TPA: PEP-utilizing enzyme, partial [Candidatus Nanoarchaeia archaeon]|nr:PEP-utilizing enzyme [Candidatus Nanoarchaeia archaeon]
MVTLYYDEKEMDKFYYLLIEKLKEKEFLDTLVKDFIENVEKGRQFFNKDLTKEEIIELYKISIKCWPGTSIFDIISNCPEVVNCDESIINLLLKIRKSHGEFLYEFDDFLLNAIIKLYPYLDGFEDAILIQEFESGKFPSKEELEKRKKYYTLYSHYLETDISFELLSKEHNIEIIKRILDNVNEVRGDIAMRGKARGVVKIIFKVEDANDVKHEDILVASMTTPDHIIAMDKASAFVTDEGGIA